jgi:membrane fusion protein (multidrug efflux system)
MLSFVRRFGFAATVMCALALMAAVVVGKSLIDTVGSAISDGANASVSGQGGPATDVAAASVSRRAFTDAIQALGTAQALESIVITPKVADTIRSLRFESGDRVGRGQVLVEMSSVEQQADLAEESAALEAANEELRRAQELFDRGFASQARLDAVKASADAARARVDANASRAADRTLRAPFAGVIGLRLASPGQYVRPGDRIGTLDDLSEIKLDFDVPETQMSRLINGAPIVAHTAAYPEMSFEGVIANIDSRVDSASRTVRVRALLPNPDERLRPGMLLTVEVQANAREALAIPEIAILDRADGAYVYRVVQGEGAPVTELVRIEAGQRSNGMAEVLAGLNADDRVITEGVQSVRPGQPVRLSGGADAVAEPTPSPRG